MVGVAVVVAASAATSAVGACADVAATVAALVVAAASTTTPTVGACADEAVWRLLGISALTAAPASPVTTRSAGEEEEGGATGVAVPALVELAFA